MDKPGNFIPVSYTHLDVYKRQFLFYCNIWEENVHQQLQKEAAFHDNPFVNPYNL